jgi:hypothetical protein
MTTTATVSSVSSASSVEITQDDCSNKPAAGYCGLAEAIIAQACKDYQKLRQEGIVVGDHVSVGFDERARRNTVLQGAYAHKSQCIRLISWLKDGSLHNLLDESHLNMNADWLLGQLGVTSA